MIHLDDYIKDAPKTIHLLVSEENRVTVCTKEPYDPPELPEGVEVHICSVCRKESTATEDTVTLTWTEGDHHGN